MANQEHVARLKEGGLEWNVWRQDCDELPDLREANLLGANLREADLSGAQLGWAQLNLANLIGANLREADLSEANLREADASVADFSGANLREANLSETNLFKADLRGADLTGAHLIRANLIGANLLVADLREANLIGANLREADFREADLREADLSRANLSEANLSGARVAWTVFGHVDLSVAKGLDSVIHDGPSTIGVDTVYASGGRIPEVFLRGAGVPDNFIAYVGALVGTPIQFYSCFISYSSQDQPFAERLHADLQAKGVRCWFAPHNISGGKKLHEQIDEAIRLHDRLLLILSDHSMDSEWVKTEIAKARKRELTENRRMLFPVRLVDFDTLRNWECFDADTGKDSAREIREYFIRDFTHWREHDRYKEAFDGLLDDLKLDNVAPTRP